jgi:hypothetical protein
MAATRTRMARGRGRMLACAALCALLTGVMGPMASAQTTEAQAFRFDRGRNQGVAERPRPDFDPLGLRYGSLILRPEVTVEVGSDSNVSYSAANEQEDTFLVLKPRVAAETDWSRHALRAELGLDDIKFQDVESEDHTDVYARGEGRLDIRRGTYLLAGGAQERFTERRGDPDSPLTAAKPIRVELRRAHIAAAHEFNRARVSLRLDREGLNYKDAPLIGGGIADQDQRDHITTTLTGRVEYALSPDTALVAQAATNRREYEVSPPRAPVDRDSEGASYLVGINTDLTNLIRGEIILGYLYQDYDDPTLETARGLAAEANIAYFATPLTTLTFKARREVEETLTTGASSYVATSAEARVDHELRRNVLLTAGVGMLNRDFQGMTRDDDILLADAGARFLLNRRIELGARWRYERQESSGPIADPDYDVNRFSVSATLRF